MSTAPARFCWKVPEGACGERLDRALTRWLTSGPPSEAYAAAGLTEMGVPTRAVPSSRAQIQALLGLGAVRVAGAPARASRRLRVGEEVTLQLPPLAASPLAPVPLPLAILYEDAHLLVLNKPAHLRVHPGAGGAGPQAPTLVQGLLAHCTQLSQGGGIGGVVRPGIVHRLDKDTTGVMVVAKDNATHAALAAQFAARTVHKRYLALVTHAGLRVQAGVLNTPYGRHPRHRQRFTGQQQSVAVTKGRRAITEWQLVANEALQPAARAPYLALVACTLKTGRTHQLRVHLAEMGCPIVGDGTYGRGSAGVACAALAQLDHQALHAYQLRFVHPKRGQAMTFHAPLPASWQGVATALYHRAPVVGAPLPEESLCA